MNKELELFYILPYTKNYNSGGHYYNDDKGCVDYSPASVDTWTCSPLIFDKKEQLLNWFCQNPDKPIPIIYKIKFIANYQGVDDVIKITNLNNGKTDYYTALSKNYYAWYDEHSSKLHNKIIWDYRYMHEIFNFDYIYTGFSKRGVEIKFNAYKNDDATDKINCFEFFGDIFYCEERKKAKNKTLILYRNNPNNW